VSLMFHVRRDSPAVWEIKGGDSSARIEKKKLYPSSQGPNEPRVDAVQKGTILKGANWGVGKK